MNQPPRIAFFAPIKPPDHPIPSGDRLIARNLVKALSMAGFTVDIASEYICYSKRSGDDYLRDRKSGALVEVDRLIREYDGLPPVELPQLWLTYHPYCKAPDWIGPAVSEALGIPYVTVEAARTGQGGPEDEWKPWREEAQVGIKQADRHLVFKPTDRAYLSELLGSQEKLFELKPFIDLEGLSEPTDQTVSLPENWDHNTPTLITTGMMRKGKKDRNFYMLAETLTQIQDANWNLVIVGGGPEEDSIREAFSGINQERLHWTGQVTQAEVLAWMKLSDIFIWPGWKEPIGMVYLEAQLQGLPVIAFESMGVPLVVQHQETGLLAPENDDEQMQANIIKLLKNKELRASMGSDAHQKVLSEHSLEAASSRLQQVLSDLIS